MSFTDGPYRYNRFDMYEKKLDPVGKEDKDIDNDGDVRRGEFKESDMRGILCI